MPVFIIILLLVGGMDVIYWAMFIWACSMFVRFGGLWD